MFSMHGKFYKILAVVLAASLLFCFIGCGKGARQPEEVADLVLTYIQQGKMKKALALMHNPEDYILGDSSTIELNEALRQHLSWSFGEKRYDAENDYYMIEASITMVDLAVVMGDLMTKYFDQMLSDAIQGVSWEDDQVAEQLTADINAIITSEDAPVCTDEILIYVVPDPEGDWKVFVEDEFINAVTGGVLELYEFYSYGN